MTTKIRQKLLTDGVLIPTISSTPAAGAAQSQAFVAPAASTGLVPPSEAPTPTACTSTPRTSSRVPSTTSRTAVAQSAVWLSSSRLWPYGA